MKKTLMAAALFASMVAGPAPRFAAFAAPADGGNVPTIRPLMVLRPIAATDETA